MNDTVEVYLPRQSKPVLLDSQDFCDVWQRFHWGVEQGYLRTGSQRRRELGWFILQPQPPCRADHINLNTFDNRRLNLRPVTKKQNAYNAPKRSTRCSSRFKGVAWDKNLHKWRAAIAPNGKTKYLGVFVNELDAAQAYNNAAVQHFGEFARLNEITQKGTT